MTYQLTDKNLIFIHINQAKDGKVNRSIRSNFEPYSEKHNEHCWIIDNTQNQN